MSHISQSNPPPPQTNASTSSTRPSSLRARFKQNWNPLASRFRAVPSSASSPPPDPLQNLLLLLRIGDQTSAIKLLQESPKLCFARDPSTGLTPLHIAASGYMSIIELLLQGGASPLEKDRQGWNVMHMACNSSSPAYLDIVETLLRATPEASRRALISACNDANTTPFGLLCRNTCYTQLGAPGFLRFSDTLKAFLHLGADVNHQTELGISPLHEATSRRNLTGINLLVENGALLNLINLAGESPLHWAVQNGDPTIARALLTHGADPDLATSSKGTPAALGLDSGNEGMIKVFTELIAYRSSKQPSSSASSVGNDSASPPDSTPPLAPACFPTVLNLDDDPVLLSTLQSTLTRLGKLHYYTFYNDVRQLRALQTAPITQSFPTLLANYFADPPRVGLIFRVSTEEHELFTPQQMWATLDVLQHNVIQHLNRALRELAIMLNPALAQVPNAFAPDASLDMPTDDLESDDNDNDNDDNHHDHDHDHGTQQPTSNPSSPRSDNNPNQTGSNSDNNNTNNNHHHQQQQQQHKETSSGIPFSPKSASASPSTSLGTSLSISFSNSSLAEPSSTKSAPEEPISDLPTPSTCATPASTCPPTCLCSNAPIGPHSFEIVKFLGRGSCGEVYLVRRTSCRTKQELLFAMKVLTKRQILQQNKVGRVLMEQEILMLGNSPFIVKLFYSFQTEHFLHFVIELCIGGTLFRLVKGQPNSRISEEFVRFYAAEVLLALEHLHAIGYVHRDIKPENILISDDGHLKLADFDLSANIEATTHHPSASRRPRLSSFVGTPDYLSPEVVQGGPQSYVLDFWSLGVLIFEMLFGSSPFITSPTSRSSAVSFRYVIPPEPRISPQARSLIHSLLQPAEKRIGRRNGVQEIKAHPWFEGIDWQTIDQIQAPFDPRSYLSSPTDTRYFRNTHQRQLSKAYYESPLVSAILPLTDPFYPFLLLSAPILASELPAEPSFASPDATGPVRDNAMVGWMYKQGWFRKNWKYRWFVLSQEKGIWSLKYFLNQSATKLLGQVDLSQAETICSADIQRFSISIPPDAKAESLFHLVLPNRSYHLIAPSLNEKDAWLSHLSKILPIKL